MMKYLRRALAVITDKRYRRWVAVAILLATLVFVIRFFTSHPEYLDRLGRVSPLVIIIVVLLNVPCMLALAWAYAEMLRLCGKPIDAKENLLLTAYSSIINFFGPLQSGPGVRAVYLKARHGVRMRDYLLATLIYYGFFATYSALFFLAGTRPWWQTLLGLSAVAGFSFLVIRWFAQKGKRSADSEASGFNLAPATIAALGLAVFVQLLFIASYYFVELRAVDPQISLSQAVSYAGAANFSLFVSITPDAVGIREAFLVFSQQVHHVSTADILNANIIDRGSYLIYLGLAFLVTLGVHARDRLHLRRSREA